MPARLLPPGLVSLSDYSESLASPSFAIMERYSRTFVEANSESLRKYGSRWVPDPLRQWSRRWEYPFCHAEIAAFAGISRRPLEVLDAGSGLTFFPFFLAESGSIGRVTCCDSDVSLESAFAALSGSGGDKVEFIARDLRDTGLESNSLDAVYCISVLEHTGSYAEISEEFRRILRSDGVLIVTFDISLDGLGEIGIDRLPSLIAALTAHFRTDHPESIAALLDSGNLFRSDIVSTATIAARDPTLLPWRFPRLSLLKSAIKKKRFPRGGIKKLTFSCHTFRPSRGRAAGGEA